MLDVNTDIESKKLRFIDLSSDGGCSQKAAAIDLTSLLTKTAAATGSGVLKGMAGNLPDVGQFTLEGIPTVSTVDILFPMIDDPTLFGRIVVNHVLNDIYAAFAEPKFSLAILGIHKSISADDFAIVKLLSASTESLMEAAAPVVGGHTLSHQENLFLGFSIVGTPIKKSADEKHQIRSGDSLLMTKRLGTSIASLRWKLKEEETFGHEDVLTGMLQSSQQASKIAAEAGVNFCTDISGFGLINNLHALATRAEIGVDLFISEIPVYKSIVPHLNAHTPTTRQFYHNLEFSRHCSINWRDLREEHSPLYMDSQTAGGLLFLCPQAQEIDLCDAMVAKGIEVRKIGRVNTDASGSINLIN